MRIVLQGSLGLYGVDTFVHSLQDNLMKMGFTVSISVPFGRQLVRAGKKVPIRAEAAVENTGWWRPYRDADLVHVSYALASLPLTFASIRTPLIYTIHGVPLPQVESQLFYKVGYTLERLSLRRVARASATVVTISEYGKKILMKSFGVEPIVIRNGVDTELFHSVNPSNRDVLKSRLSLPFDRQVVLSVGRLHPSKDPLTLVQSMPHILSRLPDVYFVLIGDGPLKPAVEAEISRLNLGNFCRLIPRLDHSQMPQWYQACDAYVSSAPQEMLGIAVLEAMASGLPVIAADTGGPCELLGSSGVLFKSGDPVDLAEKTSLVLSDTQLARDIGQKTREISVECFRWEVVAKRYAELYSSAFEKI